MKNDSEGIKNTIFCIYLNKYLLNLILNTIQIQSHVHNTSKRKIKKVNTVKNTCFKYQEVNTLKI